AVENARLAVGDNILLAGNLAGMNPSPTTGAKPEDYAQHYFDQASLMAGEGVDLVVVETITNFIDLRAALVGCQAALGNKTPWVVSVVPRQNGALLDNTAVTEWVPEIKAGGASGAGLNCFCEMRAVCSVVSALDALAPFPLFVKPNAGIPHKTDNRWVYPVTEKEFCNEIQKLLGLPITVVGGCCGTDPHYIKELAALLTSGS
ncbi:MAG TPA: homocysteine S-methyltransferase family protein, partial [bacterium]|nr:homocysteine S-methyltransferase family protein [bacterium]